MYNQIFTRYVGVHVFSESDLYLRTFHSNPIIEMSGPI